MLKNAQFGEISAEVELEVNPDFIVKGFYDFNNILNKLLNERHYIVLGNKGSGKSIIGEHIRLTCGLQEDNTCVFVNSVSLSQFPYKSFKKIISGTSEAESKLPTTWKWLLLIHAYKSFNEDIGKDCEFDIEFNNAVETLKEIGVLPSDLNKIAILASKKSFKIKLPIFEATQDSLDKGGELHYLHIVDYLERIILKIRSNNKHYLIIDGLDELLSHRDIQYESIAALITEARDINRRLREGGTPFKIIVLCRKDLYKRLPGANKNKITNAFSVDLDWYQDHVPIEHKEIVKLAIFRANIFGEKGNIFEKYFPRRIENKTPMEYLIENTRYTPRDFLQLLTYIARNTAGNIATFSDIRTGIKEYSNKYFWPEIEDELDGYVSKEDVSKFKKLLVHYHQRHLELKELSEFAGGFKEYEGLDLHRIMETLYECGAVSNKFVFNGKDRFQSRIKDDNDFNDQMTIVLHRGMWKALNIG